MATLTMTPQEVAEYEAFKASQTKSQAASVITRSVGKKQAAKITPTKSSALPDGVEETATEYIIHVPKNQAWHVSKSGKSIVIRDEFLLPKGTEGLGVYTTIFKPV